jgi:hypothetical protein
MAASFARTTACELRGLPKAMRWFDHLSIMSIERKGTRSFILQAFLDNSALRSDTLGDDHPPFVILPRSSVSGYLDIGMLPTKLLRMTGMP